MDEIALCLNRDCLLKNICYRYRAVPRKGQGYCDYGPVEDGDCPGFEGTREGDKLQPMEANDELEL